MKNIFLHGMGQTASSWEKTISNLPKSAECDCPELSSFYTKGNCTYNTIYSAMCSHLNTLSGKINLCGLSLGAVLGLNYALDYPEKILSLVLIAPQFKMPVLLLKLQNLIFKFMPDSQFSEIGFTKNDFITLTNSMQALDFTDRLNNLSVPTLILCGEKDKANVKSAKKLAAALPDSTFTAIQNASHEVNTENPSEVALIIKDFFSL